MFGAFERCVERKVVNGGHQRGSKGQPKIVSSSCVAVYIRVSTEKWEPAFRKDHAQTKR
jgi:hypothetical protein